MFLIARFEERAFLDSSGKAGDRSSGLEMEIRFAASQPGLVTETALSIKDQDYPPERNKIITMQPVFNVCDFGMLDTRTQSGELVAPHNNRDAHREPSMQPLKISGQALLLAAASTMPFAVNAQIAGASSRGNSPTEEENRNRCYRFAHRNRLRPRHRQSGSGLDR